MSVNRCVCRNVTFQEMLDLRAQGLTLPEIRRRTGCCSGCGNCEPYIRLALATGQTRVPIMSGRRLVEARRLDPDQVGASV